MNNMRHPFDGAVVGARDGKVGDDEEAELGAYTHLVLGLSGDGPALIVGRRT